ncbi:MAG: hypothetical protein GF417_01900 [Candidatus Latescibacteria bacterium]|nr:hypothetical protein [Candidatus Latescibacterota bacterium]
MPGGDRSGPRGMGPMTGRGAGYCTGNNVPGYMNPYPGGGFGRGRGWGMGRGGGFGWGRGYGRGWGAGYAPYAVPPAGANPAESEEEYLTREAEYLKSRLDEINKRLEEKDSGK